MRIVANPPSGGKKPTTPTIGTATDGGTGTTVSVAFTPSTYIGKSTITYTALSSPGSLTGTGSGSPITVSGLTTGTAYTFTVKGDTNYGVASDYSAASNSVTPASPSSFESIATAVANGSSGTVTFSSIPSTYKSLQIRFANWTDNYDNLCLRFNGDTGSNYTYTRVRGSSAASSVEQGTSQTNIQLTTGQTLNYGNDVLFGGIVDIHDYASTAKTKTIRTINGKDNNGSGIIVIGSGLWLSTSAITSITLFADGGGKFQSPGVFSLYGIKG